MHKTDLWSGAIVCLLGILCLTWVIPATTEYSEDFTLQPALYPSVAAWVMVIFGGLLFVNRLLKRTPVDSAKVGLTWANALHLLFMGVVLGLALWGFATLSFVKTGIILIAVLMFYVGERRPVVLVLTAVLTPLMIYGVFEKWLEMPLP